jgi:prepilin-type N-terminal cleavage/methylation domain-containing protein
LKVGNVLLINFNNTKRTFSVKQGEMPKPNLQFNNKVKSRGFTLIELLVVIAIISLVASLGGGMLFGTYDRLKVDKAASNLLLTAKYARMMAIEQQRQYTLCMDSLNNEFYLVTTLFDEQTGQIDEIIVQDPYCKPVMLENNIRFEDMNITPMNSETAGWSEDLSTIAFFPDGTAQSAVVQIGNEKTHYTLSINAATGRVKLTFGTLENVKASTIDLDAEL